MEDIKCGKGILHYADNAESTQINYNITWKEIETTLQEYDKKYQLQQKVKAKRINDNINYLTKRSKELDKEILAEVLAVVIVDQPVGSKFFDRNKEWFE